MDKQSQSRQRLTIAAAGDVTTLRKACDAFEALTGEQNFVSDPALLALFELLVRAKSWNYSLGACKEPLRMHGLLQDFISHTSVKGER